MADNGDPEQTKQPSADGARPRSEQNEWTASDKRGPLGEAEAAAETEPERAAGTAADPLPSTPASPGLDTPSPDGAPQDETRPDAPVQAAPPSAEPGAAVPPRRHVPVLPIIAALVVGAVIGAASAAAVYATSSQGASRSDVDALASRLDAVEKRPDPQPELDRLKAEVAKATDRQPATPAFDPAPLQQKIAGLQAEVDAVKTKAADPALGDKVAALGTAVAALEAQGARVKGLDDKVAGIVGAVGGLRQDVGGLKQEDAKAEAGIASLQSDQKALEGRAGAPALAVAADSLVGAIADGRPYAGQVDALASLGADPARIAVLRENADKGVPSARVLAAKFAPLADPIVATASQAPANAGLGDRLKAGFFGMVQVRRSDATAGDDIASRVARIETGLAHDDVAGAYATWIGLPAEAKAKSEAWGALAKTQVEAMTAARALQTQAIATLGKKS